MKNKKNSCITVAPLSLEALGWNEELAEAFSRYAGPYVAGRVACRQKTVFDVFVEGSCIQAGISGALRRFGRIPVVGDFVVVLSRPEAGVFVIVDILPRKTIFSRGVPGKDGADQVIAANIDTVFIVTSAGRDLNARRLERYLALVHASGARPVILINKSDLAGDPASLVGQISQVAGTVPVLYISALMHTGFSQLDQFLVPGKTIALIGSSGVGKSTLINSLLEEAIQETEEVREYDGKGHHKTTVRQMFVLRNGTLVIDNPGLREVGIGTQGSGLYDTFPEIFELAAGCRFSDCTHVHEPGCAVREAVECGNISDKRLQNFLRLSAELAFEKEKADIGLVRIERKRWKKTSEIARNIRDLKGR
jgi:ribosome biogenesis GTPase